MAHDTFKGGKGSGQEDDEAGDVLAESTRYQDKRCKVEKAPSEADTILHMFQTMHACRADRATNRARSRAEFEEKGRK